MRLSRFALALSAGFMMACGNASGPGITLQVTPDSVQLFRHDSLLLSVSALDGTGHLVTGVAVTFTSENSRIATVSALGMVHSDTVVGRTIIRVSGGGATRDVPVIVTGIPSAMQVTPADTTVRATAAVQYRAVVLDEVGDTIHGASISWQSTDTSIASVTGNGLAVAKSKVGGTFIVARLNGLAAAGTLHVAVPGVATQITITPADTAILAHASVQLTATVRDAFGTPVSGATIQWFSDNTSVATVSSTGLVQSVGPSGTAPIRATSDTLTGNASVTVLDSLLTARAFLNTRFYAANISSQNVAYVGESDLARIARANLSSHTLGATAAVGSTPTELAFNSTGSKAYVANQGSSTVSVVDVATNSHIDDIQVGNRPFEVIVAPGDSVLYVAKVDSVYGVRLATKEIIARFGIPDLGNGVAIVHDTLLYVSTHTGGTVVEFNLRTRTVARTFTVGGVPQKLAVSADSTQLYIANEAGYVQFWDLDSGLQIGSNLSLPSAAYGIARRATNGLLYVTQGAERFGPGYLFVVDPATRTLLSSDVIGGAPRHIVFTADGSTGLIPNENGWVDFLR